MGWAGKHVALVLVVLAIGCARHELLRPIGPVPGGTISGMDDGEAVTQSPLHFTGPYVTTLFGSAR